LNNNKLIKSIKNNNLDLELNNYDINSQDIYLNKVENFFLKRGKIRKKKIIKHFLFIKLTLNNLFAYVYNYYNTKLKRNRYKVLRSKDLNFFSVSLGLTKYKGSARLSNIALEKAGSLLREKLVLNNIRFIHLVLHTRLNRKIKEFLRGFSRYSLIQIRRIIFFPKIAHNGTRLKSKKRL
jgi:hypothetical protein